MNSLVRRWHLMLLAVIFTMIFPVQAQSDISPFTPITAENAAQLRLLDTIPNYNEHNSCYCDPRRFSENGQVLATDEIIHDFKTSHTFYLEGLGSPIAVSPDGSLVLVTGNEVAEVGTYLIEVETGIATRLMDAIAEAATFSPDGSLITLSSYDVDAVQVWSAQTSTLIKSLQRPTSTGTIQPQFTRDSRYLIYITDDRNLNRWEVDLTGDTESEVLSSDVDTFAFAADGETMLVQTADYSNVQIWDVATARLRTNFESNRASLTLSPDGRRLMTIFSDFGATITLWDITTETPLTITKINTGSVARPFFTPDSRYLVLIGQLEKPTTSSNDTPPSEIQFLNSETGRSVDRYVLEDTIVSAGFTPSGMMITTSRGKGINLWSLEGTQVEPLAQIAGENYDLSPDGSTVVIELQDGFQAIFGIESAERPARLFTLPAEIVPSYVNVRSMPNPDAEVVGSAGGQVQVFGQVEDYTYLPEQQGWVRTGADYLRLADGLTVDHLPQIDPSEIGNIPAAPIIPTVPELAGDNPLISFESAPSLETLQLESSDAVLPLTSIPDGLVQITPDNLDQVALVGVLPGVQIGEANNQSISAAISLDGTTLITPQTRDASAVQVWDLLTLKVAQSIELQQTSEYNYSALFAGSASGFFAYTPDEYQAPAQLRSLDGISTFDLPKNNTYRAYRAFRFSPDGNTLFYNSIVMDVPTGTIRATITPSGNVVFSPDSSRFAIIADERVYTYDTATGQALASTPRDPSYYAARQATFSPDNRWLATLNTEQMTVYDADTGKAVFDFPLERGSNSYATRLAFSPSGQYLTMLERDSKLTIFDVTQPEVIGQLEVPGVQELDFSPDGRLLAMTNPLRLIDLATGEEVSIEGNYEGENIAFSPDGATLLMDTNSGWYNTVRTVMVFGVPTDARPVWESGITATVVPSSINVRSAPDADAAVIGTASGEVRLTARDANGSAVYISDLQGWIWSDPEYLDLAESALDALPQRAEN
jgi:WD40 repeat protein